MNGFKSFADILQELFAIIGIKDKTSELQSFKFLENAFGMPLQSPTPSDFDFLFPIEVRMERIEAIFKIKDALIYERLKSIFDDPTDINKFTYRTVWINGAKKSKIASKEDPKLVVTEDNPRKALLMINEKTNNWKPFRFNMTHPEILFYTECSKKEWDELVQKYLK